MLWRKTLGHLFIMVILGGVIGGVVIIVGLFRVMTLKVKELSRIPFEVVRPIVEMHSSDNSIVGWQEFSYSGEWPIDSLFLRHN